MSERKNFPYRLFAPGPVPLSEGVRKALAEPMIHHRSEAFQGILNESLTWLRHVFQTSQPVMILTSAGTGAMEAAIINTLSPGDEALFIVSGKFGERWFKMGQALGLKCHCLEVPWGSAVQTKDLESSLKKFPQVKAVFCQVCETSTAVLHPIKELSGVIRSQNPETLFIVDAMTALGATPLPMDDWQLDVVVAGSQKAFMLPAGLSFIALSERAWKAYEISRSPKFYFDLGPERKSNLGKETRFSSSVSLIRGLHCALKERFVGDELQKSIQRSQSLAQITRNIFTSFGWQLYSQAPSSSVTAAVIPEEMRKHKIPSLLLDQFNIFVAGGQDSLKGKIIRVGHLGHITDDDQIFFALALGQTLKNCGWQLANSEKVSQVVEDTKLALIHN